MGLAAAFAFLLGQAIQPAAARIRPTRHGDWQMVCAIPEDPAAIPVCRIQRAVWQLDNSGAQTELNMHIAIEFGENVRVTTAGLNAATCGNITLEERLYHGYNPHDAEPTDEVIAAFRARVAMTVRSHLWLLASCTPMRRNAGPIPPDLFDTSVADLARAIDAVECTWSRRRQQVNPVARQRETPGCGERGPEAEAAWRALTGDALARTVTGRLFTFPPHPGGVVTSPRCHRFHADGGRYEECGDRIPFYSGSYRLSADSVCATGGPGAGCWAVLAGPGGAYRLRDRSGREPDMRVCISPLGETPPPPSPRSGGAR